MNKGATAGLMLATGIAQSIWPNWRGLLYEPPPISYGDARIIGTIFIVGAAIVFFLPDQPKA
jgi:hypothetical protein